MSDAHLIATTPSAPWLPPGSTAEVWAGADCQVPAPCIIVRLLLVRDAGYGVASFFCRLTQRGLDLPTSDLGRNPNRWPLSEGLKRLAEETVGEVALAARCVGYVRNVVPRPDAAYPHPIPWAHVPVFVATQSAEPIVEGQWATLQAARADLSVRHWWPIVEHHLTSVAF